MITVAEQQHLDASRSEIIEGCRSLTFTDLSPQTVTTARHSLLDWFGCAVAGANESAAQRFREVLAPSVGDIPLVGTSEKVHWRDGVFINAFNGHLLDFDDMLPTMSGHPSVVIAPALLAVGAQVNASVEEIITSFVVGTEVGTWVASQVLPGHYDAGWHATGTVGTFAAAAAVCHLRGLAAQEWITALDAAATQAAGLKAMFGTLAKPMHAGNASQAGVIAASLSTITTSSGHALTGAHGFITNYRGAGADTVPAGDGWAIDGMLYKTFASCFMTQAAVDIGQMLREESLEEASIHLTVSPKLADVCAIENPLTAHDAKFSLHATVALAALGHDLSTESAFARISDPAYRELRGRIHLEFDPSLEGRETQVAARVTWPEGRTWTTVVDRGVPAADLGVREQQLSAKFFQLTEPHLGESAALHLHNLILTKTETSVRDLAAAASPTPIRHTTTEEIDFHG